jgi:L-ascorbate metabolism protein UlaG (beta-lactamase superfamily)
MKMKRAPKALTPFGSLFVLILLYFLKSSLQSQVDKLKSNLNKKSIKYNRILDLTHQKRYNKSIMVITYQGVEAIKIQHGDLTVAFNPPSKESKYSATSFGADVVLITANHPDLNGADQASRKEKEAFVIKGPGEYEVDGLFIRGFASKTNYGGKMLNNTIYTMTIDGLHIAYLGAFDEADLSAEAKEELGESDILFVPIGGDGVLNASDAYKAAVKREPKIIIPIHFNKVGEKDALKKFLDEGGQDNLKPVDKLTIKKKEIENKKGEIVVLKD